MYLIVGLGNIGQKFDGTRHNIGFEVVDKLAQKYNASFKEKFNGVYSQVMIGGKKVILLKPSTYMNLSGECVRPFVDYFDVEIEDLFIIHDDIEFDLGTLKIRKKGGAGTHNGMKSIIGLLGESGFPRLRFGVGNDKGVELANYVLGRFRDEEKEVVALASHRACEIVESYLSDGIDFAMNKYNIKKEKKKKEKTEQAQEPTSEQ